VRFAGASRPAAVVLSRAFVRTKHLYRLNVGKRSGARFKDKHSRLPRADHHCRHAYGTALHAGGDRAGDGEAQGHRPRRRLTQQAGARARGFDDAIAKYSARHLIRMELAATISDEAAVPELPDCVAKDYDGSAM
jgi:hypothetical protein